MEALDLLKTSLLDLHAQLKEHEIPLILGGGYGLFLKQLHLWAKKTRTLFEIEVWPEARSTSDLDLFLRAEVVIDPQRMSALRHALDTLGYEVVETAKFYQFVKALLPSGFIKVDLLVGPLGELDSRAKKDARRVRPKRRVNLHARRVDEALGIEERCMAIPLSGRLSTGDTYEAVVYVPQGFSYLMMKLFAFRDRKDDPDKEMGRHHALDIFRIMAMMTKDEYESARTMREQYAEDPWVREAAQILCGEFGGDESIGALRLREHPLFRREMDVEKFLRELRAIFAVGQA
jgi:hypothetical protein